MNATSNAMDQLGPNYLAEDAEGQTSLLGSPAIRIWLMLLAVIFGLGALGGFTQLADTVVTSERSDLIPLFGGLFFITAVLAFTVGQAAGSTITRVAQPGLGTRTMAFVDTRQIHVPAPHTTTAESTTSQPNDGTEDFTEYFDVTTPKTYDSLQGGQPLQIGTGPLANLDVPATPPTTDSFERQPDGASVAVAAPLELAAKGPRWLLAIDNFLTRPLSRRTIVTTVVATSSLCAFATWHWVGSIGETLTALIGVAVLSALFSRVTHVAAQNRQVVDDLRETNNHLVQEIVNRRGRDQAVATSVGKGERWESTIAFDNAPLPDLEALRTKFLNEVSHELRGPITAINLAARIIMKHHVYDHDVVERFGSTIVSEGDRLAQIVNEFLELAKIESGCLRWNEDRIEPIDVATSAIFAAEATANEHEIKLTPIADEDLPAMFADRDRIVQALTILLTTALRKSPRESTITLHVRRGPAETLFAIEDQGKGTREEKQFNIFASSQPSHEKTGKSSGDTGGQGLGLCIASEIAAHYGGEVWAEGRVGAGSAYVMSIPDSPPAAAEGTDVGTESSSDDESSDTGAKVGATTTDIFTEIAAKSAATVAATSPILGDATAALPTILPLAHAATVESADAFGPTEAADATVQQVVRTETPSARHEAADSLGQLGEVADTGDTLEAAPLTDAYLTGDAQPWETEYEQYCASEQMSMRELDDVLYGRAASPITGRFGGDDDEDDAEAVDSSVEAEESVERPHLTEVKRGFGFSLFRNEDRAELAQVARGDAANSDSGDTAASATPTEKKSHTGTEAPLVDAFGAWVAQSHAAATANGDAPTQRSGEGTETDDSEPGNDSTRITPLEDALHGLERSRDELSAAVTAAQSAVPAEAAKKGSGAEAGSTQARTPVAQTAQSEPRKPHGAWRPAPAGSISYVRRTPHRH